MKKLLKISLVFAFVLALNSYSAIAQKYGHLNSGNLMAALPEVEVADKSLATYQEQLAKAFKIKVDDFKSRAQAFTTEAQSGKLPPVKVQEQQAKLQKEQQELGQEEQKNMELIQKKRQELLGPILQKVDEAIQKVGKDNGYTMIFDTSMINTVLFAKDSEDVMPLVKAALGIK